MVRKYQHLARASKGYPFAHKATDWSFPLKIQGAFRVLERCAGKGMRENHGGFDVTVAQ